MQARVIDNWLPEDLLTGLKKDIEEAILENSYAQNGMRRSLSFGTKAYNKAVNQYKHISKTKDYIFEGEGKKERVQEIGQKCDLTKLSVHKTEFAISSNIFQKVAIKFIRNNIYKSKYLHENIRKLRKIILGERYHITFSISESFSGYEEQPHLDQKNKLVVGLLYLDDIDDKIDSALCFWTRIGDKNKINQAGYIDKDGLRLQKKKLGQKRID